MVKVNKNRGFTLVEVLGVLVILSVVVLIAVPNINKWLRSGTEDLYRTQVNNIVLAAKNWAADNPFSLPTTEDQPVTLTLDFLKMSGKLEIDFRDPRTKFQFPGDLEIKIWKRGEQFDYEVLESSGTPVTEESPGWIDLSSITLVMIGSSTHYVEINTPFIDPGIIAKRADGSNIDVIVEITRDNEIVENIYTYDFYQYKKTYTIPEEELDRETPLSITRNIIVRDTIPPVITFPTDTVIATQDVASFDHLAGVIVTDNSGQEDIEIEYQSNLSNLPGVYQVTYTAKDDSKNEVSVTRNITVIDNINPVITIETNGNSTWSQSHSTVVTVTDNVKVNENSLRYIWNTSSSQPSESAFTNSFNNNGTLTSPVGVNGNYYLWILAKDTSGNTTIERSNVFRLDNTPPVITLNGSSNISINVETPYNEPGASVTDDHSGITGNVIITGSVNPNVPGTYQITYNKSDNAGNPATEVTRTVTVIDNVPPVVTFSMNGNSTWGQNRSTSINVTDVHSTVNTNSLRYLITTTSGGITESSFSDTLTNGSTINLNNLSGEYYIWVLAKDSVGNTAITRSNVFRLDNTNPVITHPGTTNLTVQEVPSFNLMNGVSATDAHSGVSGSISVSSNVSLIPGTYTITYSVSDNVGNSISVNRTINVSDVEAPVITILGSNPVTLNAGTPYSDAGATALDDVDGNLTSSIVTTGSVNPNVPGTYTITYTVTDSSNNTSTANRTVNVIDTTKPTISFGTNGNNTWAKSHSTSINVSDAHSGVNNSSLRYLITTTSSGITENQITTTFNNGATINMNTQTGNYYIWVLGKDNAGNTEIVRSNVFRLDNTPPVITLTGNGTITINAGSTYTDQGATVTDAHSGVTGGVTVTGTVNPNVPGTYTITYNKSDNAGNAATSVVRTVHVVDNTAPVVSFSMNGNSTWAKSRSTTVTVTDAHSGVNTSSLRYQWTTSTTQPTEASFTTSFSNGGSLSTPSGVTGDRYLWILAKDNAGNTTISRTNVFKLDNTLPVITHPGTTTINVDQVTTYNLMSGVNATDEHSGVNYGYAPAIDISGSISTIPGNYTITYTVYDYAGNQATSNRTIIVRDINAPIITILGDNPTDVYVTIPYNDAGATALDDVDGNLTSSITTSSTVNINVPGTYKVTYTVKDSSNNTSVAERTVNVIDNVPPVVSFGTNGNSTYAKSHSTTVTVTDVHSSVNTSSLRYQWTTSTTQPSEASFSTSFTNGSSISTPSGVTGDRYLWVLGKDSAGNTTITRSNVFRLDNTLPVITSVTSNVSNVEAKSFTITRSGNASDAHSGLASSPYIYQTSLNGSSWTTRCTNNSTSCNVTGLEPDTTYYYRICVNDNAANQNCLASKTTKTDEDIVTFTTDTSGANAPVLDDGMIPVAWKSDGTVVKASTTQTDWYNYNTKHWANVVLVTQSSRNTYKSAALGTPINESDVLAYLVWVPRYRYQLFNVASNSINPQTINIEFESKATSKSNGSTNGTWLTHPAFTFGGTELSGYWVGKFETTGNATTPTIKPGITSLRNQNVSTQFATAQKFNTTSTYGVTEESDSHMMKNTEWGAVSYLSHSTYGKNSEIWKNPNSNFITGCAGNSVNPSSTSACQTYTTTNGQQASTTGNMYGIYDMSGGAREYVMGGMYNNGSTTITLGSSGFNQDLIDSNSMNKYIDKYIYGTNNKDFNRRMLGDATGEVHSWYNNGSNISTNASPWMHRGSYSGASSGVGVFNFSPSVGSGTNERTFRVVISEADHPYQDNTNAPVPELSEGMIPIRWNGSAWVKADIYSQWYNYDNKEWANVVLVNNSSRATYQASTPGTVINENDVMAYLVWIPRYRYQLFNVNSDTISPRTINIEFQSKSTPKSNGSTNGSWLTHPSFTFGGTELSGYWVGKFETTGTAATPTIKPGITSLRSQTVANQFATAQKFNESTYGLTNNNDAHMMKNTEWGAVAYLAQSTYGKNAEIWINPNSNFRTGCAGSSVNASSTTACQAYTTSNGVQASTTGNVYGIYDMSGGAWEYVMGNYNDTVASSGINFSTLNSRYYDKYAGTSFNNRILGDATGEVRGWNNDYAYFVSSSGPWFIRGGTRNHGANAGAFASYNNSGSAISSYSFRVVLVGR